MRKTCRDLYFHNMIFDEEKARAIIQQLGLAESTMKVWRHRGSIPDKYSDLDAAAAVVLVKKTDPEAGRLREILSLKEINNAGFTPGKRAGDIVKGEAAIKKEEITTYKTEIVLLRNKLRLAIDRGTFKQALWDRRLHPTLIVSKSIYDKLLREAWLSREETEEVRLSLLRLYNLLRM